MKRLLAVLMPLALLAAPVRAFDASLLLPEFLGGPSSSTHSQANLERGLVQIVSIVTDDNGNILFTRDGNPLYISTGTGILLDKQGHVATNYHVINLPGALSKGMKHALYVNPEGRSYAYRFAAQNPNAVVVHADPDRDIALLQADNLKGYAAGNHAILTSVTPNKSEPVFAVGYPGLAYKNDFQGESVTSDASHSAGDLSRVTLGHWGRAVPLEIIFHTADISWGNSGGPLLDGCGRVIGINTQISLSDPNVKVAASGFNKSSSIRELLKITKTLDIAPDVENSVCPTDDERSTRNFTWLGTGIVVALALILGAVLRRPSSRPPTPEVAPSPRAVPPGNVPKPPPYGGGGLGGNPTAPVKMPRQSIVLDGSDSKGRRITLTITRDQLLQGAIIGRNPDNAALTIPVEEVSRRHAKIFWRDDVVYVEDLSSTHGTILRGKKLRPGVAEIIASNDSLEFGPMVSFKIRFQS